MAPTLDCGVNEKDNREILMTLRRVTMVTGLARGWGEFIECS